MPDPWGAERALETESEDDQVIANWHPRASLSSVSNVDTGSVSTAKARPVVARTHSSKFHPSPWTLEVWASLMDKSKGRDKVLKTVQYSMRTYLYVLGLIASVRPLARWFAANRKRTQIAVAGLSLTRKCLLLLNPLRPIGALLSPEPTSAPEFLGHLMDLMSAVADDVFCLSRLGLMSRKKGNYADKWANRLWFTATITGLYGLYIKSFRQRDEREISKDEWQLRKYLCDLVFVTYDVFHLTWAKEPVQCVVGLCAALIGTGQLYTKERDALALREK